MTGYFKKFPDIIGLVSIEFFLRTLRTSDLLFLSFPSKIILNPNQDESPISCCNFIFSLSSNNDLK